MKPLYTLGLAALLPFVATAQEAAAIDPSGQVETMAEEVAEAYGPRNAADVVFADLMFEFRPVVVFGDSPADPNFIRQMELLQRDLPALQLRDVVLITDTDPEARGEWRMKLRPRGFSLVLMDKDLRPVIRKPLPWEVREITAAIDKFPLRRQEILERNPAGRR
ncbi:DUF4174 domain-containing protein [Pseudotabrizicola alkalilacus]|uniref:DUF4174 domain-containing protein n=1 Tax=Pseudotabrizicola alkalilacus TaxID=2305252 RepID=A0A411Z759_9RHOB|nr:DUF4174 domain-containing protein [Pseudotabrizicola alkalilacus]RGP38889.1 DUF4174 domain-containing protein [Pseudotabrizicola alkalilacus]